MKTEPAERPTYLYRCFDSLGVLLYVGVTGNPEARMQSHAAGKFWWCDVAKIENMAFKTREQALWAEWAVITTCHPLYNIAASLPTEHRCPPPPPPPMPIDGHIYMLQQFAKIEANRESYDRLDRQIDALFAGADIPPNQANAPRLNEMT